MTIKITKGLDLSLEGEVNHQVLPEVKNLTSRVAVLGKDFHGIRPTMFVSEGQQVSQGEKLFEELFLDGQSTRTKHPRIFKANESSKSLDKFQDHYQTLSSFDVNINSNDIKSAVKELVPEYLPHYESD